MKELRIRQMKTSINPNRLSRQEAKSTDLTYHNTMSCKGQKTQLIWWRQRFSIKIKKFIG